ncbi:MAG: type II toxin-antitoxin system VapC family toxin [Rhodocyclaceae bacterium]|nr:type II toxin-antitoxin system VapC family toxin [Rhodocyclaceae bacterium]
MNVVDSSGWIEFFLASAAGLHFKPAIEDTRHLLVPVITLYEVHKRLSRNLPTKVVANCLDVMRLGRVLELTDARAVAASITAAAHNLALADAAIYSMALEHNALLWTQDVDYQDLPGVNYFAKGA